MKKKTLTIIIFLCIVLVFVNLDSLLYVQAVSNIGDGNEEMDIYFNGKRIRHTDAYMINTGIYVPVNMIGKYIYHSGIAVDELNSRIVIDISKMNLLLEDQDVTNFVKSNMKEAYIPLKNIDNEYYFPLDVLQSFFHVSYNISKDNVYIEEISGLKTMGNITKDDIDVKPSVSDERSENLTLNAGDTIEMLKETDNYYKVLTKDNIICFINKADVELYNVDVSLVDFFNFKRRKVNDYSKKVNIVWEYVYKNTPVPDSEKNQAIDVISPTWFYLKDAEGTLGNKADKGYLNQVKNAGYKVWGLATNSFDGNMTNIVLNNEALSKKLAAQLLFYASLYNLDGLNIDFESVKDEDRQALTNFVALLRTYTEKQGLFLSVDVMIPASWNVEYDRAALSEVTDYVAVMTYDEHWSSCTVAGSVASYRWVENAVKNTLKEVPPEKLLLGIPLYTRLWEESMVSGTTKVASKSLSMEQARQIISDRNLSVKWLDDEKQYYIEYMENGKTYKVWLEDTRSIAYKLGLVEKYNLGGSASWRKGFEEDRVWEVFYGVIKNNISSSTYKDRNYE